MSEFETDVSSEAGQMRTAGGTLDGITYQHRYVADGDEPMDVAIPYAVASASGVDPIDLQPKLFEAVDPDALEALLTGADPRTRVSFELGDREVVITGRREVYVIET